MFRMHCLSRSLSLCVALSHECIHTKGVSWCPVLKEKPSSSSLLLLCVTMAVVVARGKTGHRFSPLASCTLMCAKYASIYTMRYGIVFGVCVCVSVGLAPSVCAPWFDDPQRVAERIWNGASQIMRQIERVSPLSTLLTSSPIRRHEGPTGVFSCLLPPISIDLLCTFGTVCVVWHYRFVHDDVRRVAMNGRFQSSKRFSLVGNVVYERCQHELNSDCWF